MFKNHLFLAVATLLVSFFSSATQSQAITIYDEFEFGGDLISSDIDPVPLQNLDIGDMTLPVGTNTIIGRLSIFDSDYIAFDIAPGTQLTSIIVKNFQASVASYAEWKVEDVIDWGNITEIARTYTPDSANIGDDLLQTEIFSLA